MRKNHSILLRFMASAALAAVLLTSCAGGAATYEKQMELGRKYLTEMNYAEAIAAFTEAIKLNPDDIEAYMARAEAYAALEKYNEATADYTAVIEKTDDQPYLQATAYIGRAGVSESTAALTDAESDYAAALAQLEKDTDEQDADAVLTLKKDVLAKHAAVCITLVLFAKAAADYDALEKLGEDVSGKRSELDDLIDAEDPDAENGIPADDAENGDAVEPETERIGILYHSLDAVKDLHALRIDGVGAHLIGHRCRHLRPDRVLHPCQYKYNGPDGSEQANEIIWGKVSSVSAVKYDGEFTTIDLNYTGSLTVQGGSVYAIADENEGGGFVDFPAVGFIGD